MTDTPADNPVISYATPQVDGKPANMPLARTCLFMGIVAPVVGVSILLGYRLTAWEFFVGAGLIWLMVGGACAGLAVLIGLIGYFSTNRLTHRGADARRMHGYAILSGIIAFPLAFLCMWLGGDWSEGPHFRLRVTNNAQRQVDEVTVHFSSGDVTLDRMKPGESDTSGLLWRGHGGGPLSITVRVGDKTRTRVDRDDCTMWNLKGPYYDLQVEDSELPPP